jgi:hypothetical protein
MTVVPQTVADAGFKLWEAEHRLDVAFEVRQPSDSKR